MALVSNSTLSNQQQGNQIIGGTNEGKVKTVDVFASDAPEGEVTEVIATEDAFKPLEVPPMGQYDLQLFPSTKENYGIQERENSRSKDFSHYSIPIEARIVNNEEFEDVIIWPTVSTYVSRRRKTCTAIGLMVKAGVKPEIFTGQLTHRKMAQLMIQFLKKTPIIKRNQLDWSAGYQLPDGTWQNVARTMLEFPVDEKTAERIPLLKNVLTRMGTKVELRAQLQVVAWGGRALGETPVKQAEETKKTTTKANGALKPQKVKVEEKEQVEMTEDETDMLPDIGEE
jgi:hypothetical protein